MSNAFVGADHPVTLAARTSTRGRSASSPSVSADLRRREILEQVAPEWAAAPGSRWNRVTRAISVTRSRQAGVGAPLYGAEVADGIPVDFAVADMSESS